MKIFEIIAEQTGSELIHSNFPEINGQAIKIKDGIFKVDLMDGSKVLVTFVEANNMIFITNGRKETSLHWDSADTINETAENIVAGFSRVKVK